MGGQIGQASLAVAGADGFESAGVEGGSFSPVDKAYTVSNTGSQTLYWSASTDATWVGVDPASGSIEPGSAQEVRVFINSLATGLIGGYFEAVATFHNAVGVEGAETDRDVKLGLSSLITPGSGFVSPTVEPPAVGSGPGVSARAIARWNAVPYQSFSDEFQVGVLAFHRNEIERVEISADGGPWVSISAMNYNPRTGTWEYWATLRAKSLEQDGEVELRAIAYPKVGRPRVLESLWLYGNAGGGLPETTMYVSGSGSDSGGDGSESAPYRTIYYALLAIRDTNGAPNFADGGVVNCLPGEYEWTRPFGDAPTTTHTWITIQAAPGTSREQVQIVAAQGGANDGMETKLVHLRNVTLRAPVETSSPMEDYLWLDSVHLEGGGPTDPLVYMSDAWWSGIYVTDSLASNCVNGFASTDLARNSVVDVYSADAFPGALCIVNCEVSGADPQGTANHSDMWQERTPRTNQNVILYGLVGTQDNVAQGLFSRTAFQIDVAIVNNNIDLGGYPQQSQWITETHHHVVKYNTFRGAPLLLGLSDADPGVSGYWLSTDSVFANNVFQWLSFSDPQALSGTTLPLEGDLPSELRLENNHFINIWPDYTEQAGNPVGEVFGTGATEGPMIPAGKGYYGLTRPPWQ